MGEVMFFSKDKTRYKEMNKLIEDSMRLGNNAHYDMGYRQGLMDAADAVKNESKIGTRSKHYQVIMKLWANKELRDK